MKQHTTNYYNTLITVAQDTTAQVGTPPPERGDKKTIANWQFALLAQHPLAFTSDELLFTVFAKKQDLLTHEMESARCTFFAKGQPCMRTSPLAKSYGWGILSDQDGKIRLVDSASAEYADLLNNTTIAKVPAMKSKK